MFLNIHIYTYNAFTISLLLCPKKCMNLYLLFRVPQYIRIYAMPLKRNAYTKRIHIWKSSKLVASISLLDFPSVLHAPFQKTPTPLILFIGHYKRLVLRTIGSALRERLDLRFPLESLKNEPRQKLRKGRDESRLQ